MEKWRDAFRSQTSAGQSLTCSNCGSWDYLFQFKTAAVLIKLGNHHAAPTRFQHFRSMFSWILSSNMEPSPSLSVPPRSTGHLTLFCWNGTPLAAPNAHFSIASAIFFFFFFVLKTSGHGISQVWRTHEAFPNQPDGWARRRTPLYSPSSIFFPRTHH